MNGQKLPLKMQVQLVNVKKDLRPQKKKKKMFKKDKKLGSRYKNVLLLTTLCMYNVFIKGWNGYIRQIRTGIRCLPTVFLGDIPVPVFVQIDNLLIFGWMTYNSNLYDRMFSFCVILRWTTSPSPPTRTTSRPRALSVSWSRHTWVKVFGSTCQDSNPWGGDRRWFF